MLKVENIIAGQIRISTGGNHEQLRGRPQTLQYHEGRAEPEHARIWDRNQNWKPTKVRSFYFIICVECHSYNLIRTFLWTNISFFFLQKSTFLSNSIFQRFYQLGNTLSTGKGRAETVGKQVVVWSWTVRPRYIGTLLNRLYQLELCVFCFLAA